MCLRYIGLLWATVVVTVIAAVTGQIHIHLVALAVLWTIDTLAFVSSCSCGDIVEVLLLPWCSAVGRTALGSCLLDVGCGVRAQDLPLVVNGLPRGLPPPGVLFRQARVYSLHTLPSWTSLCALLGRPLPPSQP